MDMRQLRYFVAAARRGSITRATYDVHAAQSTISHQILRLEEELGLPLFARSPTGVALTADGEILLETAERVLRELDDVKRRLKGGVKTVSQLRILAAEHSFCLKVLPPAITQFLDKYPETNISVEQMLDTELRERIADGNFDLAIGDMQDDPADCLFVPLYHENMVLIVSPDDPLAGSRKVDLIELHNRRIAVAGHNVPSMQAVRQQFEAAGVEPEIVSTMSRPSDVLHFFQMTGIPSIIPLNIPAPPNAVKIFLERPTLYRTVGMLVPRDTSMLPARDEFLSIVTQLIRVQKLLDVEPVTEMAAAP